MSSSKNIEIIHNYEQPKAIGKHYCLLCVTGESKGTTYILKNKRIVMGRVDTADIKIYDAKSSREHAELKFVEGRYILTDLGSQNGTMVNDLKITQHTLNENDKVIIGKTVFSYKIIEREERSELVNTDDNEIEDEQFYGEDDAEPEKKTKSKRFLIYAFIGVLASFLIPEGEDKPPPQKKNKKKKENELVSFYNASDDGLDEELRVKIKAYIHQGRREMREENYFRAIEQFNMALILHPSNGEVSYLLNKTKQRLDEHIKAIFTKANQEAESFKYEQAIKQYCAIKLYLKDYPDDERFKDADKNIEYLEEKLGLDKGDSKCY